VRRWNGRSFVARSWTLSFVLRLHSDVFEFVLPFLKARLLGNLYVSAWTSSAAVFSRCLLPGWEFVAGGSVPPGAGRRVPKRPMDFTDCCRSSSLTGHLPFAIGLLVIPATTRRRPDLQSFPVRWWVSGALLYLFPLKWGTHHYVYFPASPMGPRRKGAIVRFGIFGNGTLILVVTNLLLSLRGSSGDCFEGTAAALRLVLVVVFLSCPRSTPTHWWGFAGLGTGIDGPRQSRSFIHDCGGNRHCHLANDRFGSFCALVDR